MKGLEMESNEFEQLKERLVFLLLDFLKVCIEVVQSQIIFYSQL
jgi:hypothetical protein